MLRLKSTTKSSSNVNMTVLSGEYQDWYHWLNTQVWRI